MDNDTRLLLRAIIDLLSVVSPITGTVSINNSALVSTPTSSLVATGGTVSAGSNAVNFTTSFDFVGSILGTVRQSSTSYSFSAPLNGTLSSIAYTVTTGNIIIDKL